MWRRYNVSPILNPFILSDFPQVALVGVAYTVLQFVPRIEPPSNMRKQAYDDSMAGTYNTNTTAYNANPTATVPAEYQQGGYYAQNAANPPPQSYNVGGGAV